MKKNVLSEKERNKYKKIKYKQPLIWITVAYVVVFLLFVDLGVFNNGFISTFKENFYLSIFLLLAPWMILHIPILAWFSYVPNPKYIEWSSKGIYLINQREKEEFIPWGKVESVKWVGETGFKDRLDYFIDVRGEVRKRNVNEEIGEELKEYFENIEDKVEPIEVPFYKKAAFKLRVWIFITAIIAILVGYWIYKLG
ncbi:MAG: hypothetical protein ACOC40_00445 [Thermoplasmatota archaeon]